MNLGVYSYPAAAVGFTFLAVLLSFSWSKSVQGRLLAFAVLISAVWSVLAALVAIEGSRMFKGYQLFEVLRLLAWFAFLFKLLEPGLRQAGGYRKAISWVLPFSAVLGVLLVVLELAPVRLLSWLPEYQLVTIRLAGHVLLAIIGLVILEQLYRSMSTRQRQQTISLFLAFGVVFAFDFFMYADSLLLRSISPEIWGMRGIVNLGCVPLLALAAARNKDWSLKVYVSRDIVVNSTAILASGLYLLIMAGAGYYLREVSGSWGWFAQLLFFSLAAGLLMGLLFSGQLRAQFRVFLGKHFYANKYDYRHEWLHLTGMLNSRDNDDNPLEMVIRGMAHIVDARGGLLWLRWEDGCYRNEAAWHAARIDAVECGGGGLSGFMEQTLYLVNLREVRERPEEYARLVLPPWLQDVHRGWLVVPLVRLDALLGFVVLTDPLVVRPINWEDRDLLKIAGQQIASHLAVLRATEALAEAKQFELFNRLSAYMVHDLKNISAELGLVAKNAEKHSANPEFLTDAFDTVATASGDINRLLEQLRNKTSRTGSQARVNLLAVLKEVIGRRGALAPAPELENDSGECTVIADREQLGNVLSHLVENAQQATAADGWVRIRVYSQDSMCVVEIRDNGQGMDAEFIRTRLFKPFDTTKGNAGMGIGMYESREFVRHLAGEIDVQSEVGVGTLVRLRIPAAVPG